MPIRCVLFDFDGVIADTEERNADYLASALAHFGVRLTEEDRSALVGINDPSLLEALLKRAETPVTLEQLQAERTRHGNYYENGADLHTQPGLREFLSALRAQGIRTGIVSSTRSQLILTALDRLHLVSQFDVVVCVRHGHSAQARSGTLSAGSAASGACPRRLSGHRGLSHRHPCRKSRRLYRAGLYWQLNPSGRLCGRFRPF